MSMPPQGGWPPPPSQPPQPGWQQGPWPPQPPPPIPNFEPDKSNTIKWLLIAIAVLLVVGVSIGATLLFTRDAGGGGSTSTSGVPSDIASANDTGPVAIITEEPTCKAYIDINDSLATVETGGWSDQRGALGPATDWMPDQRSQVQAVATAMRNASDQIVSLAKQTPHRVVRELYEQFVAYSRAYADKVSSYTPADNILASVSISIGNTLKGICNAIAYKSANRSLAIERESQPTHVATPGNPVDPQRFITSPDSACSEWSSSNNRFVAGTNEWEKLDSNVPGSQWTSEQRATQLAALPFFSAFASDMDSVGKQSGNPVFEDFAVLGALYIRAYVSTGDTYVAADSWLSSTGLRINNAVSGACQAVES